MRIKGLVMLTLETGLRRNRVLVLSGLALIAAGCAAAPTVRAQSPAPSAKTAAAPVPAPAPAPATPPAAEPAGEVEPATYDGSKDPLASTPDTPDAVSVIRARVNSVSILEEDVHAGCFQQLIQLNMAQNMPDDQRSEFRREILSHSLQDIIRSVEVPR